MKKLLKWAAALILVLIIVAVALPFLIPADRYKAEIINRVQGLTGRDLVIGGAMHMRVFPSLGVTIEDATLSNAPGFTTAEMMKVHRLTADVALMPLLHGEVQVKRFVLDQPVIYLEINSKGAPNWEFKPETRLALVSPDVGLVASAEAADSAMLARLAQIRLGELGITDGVVDYNDMRAHKHYQLSAVEVNAAMPTISEPLKITGTATYNAAPVSVTLSMDNMKALLEGSKAATAFALKGAPLTLTFDGILTLKSAEGTIDVAAPSLPKLTAWAGTPMAWEGAAPLAFSARGPLTCTESRCALANGDIILDAIAAKGSVAIALGEALPKIEAKLTTNELDLNPYLGTHEKHASVSSLFIANAEAAAGPEDWSNAPIDISSLRAFNADVTITTPGIKYAQFVLGKTSLHTTVSNSILKMEAPSVRLYDGNGNAYFTADARNAVPAFSYTLSFKELNLLALLRALNGFDRLTGTAEFHGQGESHGSSLKALISALSGRGMIGVQNGSFRGINLGQAARDITSLIKLNALTGAQQTDFSLLGGSYTIAQGIIHNDDFSLDSPQTQMNVKGAGTVDLPQQRLNYRLVPTIAGVAKAGKEGTDLSVPLTIEGPWSALSIRPELTAQNIQQNVKAVKEQVKNIRDNFKDIKKNPDALKGLLNGLR